MTNPLNDYLNDIPPAVTGDYPSLQRSAFGELLKLFNDAVEPAIRYNESRFRSATASDQEQRTDAEKQVQDHYRRRADSAEARHEGQVETLQTRFKTERKQLKNDTIQKRDQIVNDADALERQAHKDCEYEILVADNVADGTQAKIQQERQTIRAEIPQCRQQLDALAEQVEIVLKLYRQPSLSKLEPPAGDNIRSDNFENIFNTCKTSIESNIDLLQKLNIPRLFIGTQPYVLCFLLSVGAMFLMGWLCHLKIPYLPHIAICLPGSFLVILTVTLLTGRLLWRKGCASIRAICRPIQCDLTRGRAALELWLKQTLDRLDEKARQAEEKHRCEVDQSKRQYEQIKHETFTKRDELLAQLENQFNQALGQLEDQYKQQMDEAQRDHQAVLQDLQQDNDRELNTINDRYQNAVQSHQQLYDADHQKLVSRWQQGVNCIHAMIEQTGHLERSMKLDFNDASWQQWSPDDRFDPLVRFGRFRLADLPIAPCVLESTNLNVDRMKQLTIPAVLSFAQGCSLLVETRQTGRQQAIYMIRAVMVRLMTSQPPGRVRFTLLDPVGLGENFSGFMHAADYDEALVGRRIWTDTEHIIEQLVDLTEFMENVLQKHLRNEFETIEDYNAQAGELAEPYRFLVIADFPSRFNEECVRRLKSILHSGPRCGVFTLIAYDAREKLPSGIEMSDLTAHGVHLLYDQDRFVQQDEVYEQYALEVDSPPTETLLTGMMHRLGRAAKDSSRVEVPFEIIAPAEHQYWSLNSREEVSIPIGRTGATRLQSLRLGRGVAQHMLIAGKTGSGKSTLLHVIITNLALWYSPDEIEMYLVDFKQGVEFKAYVTHTLPHARTIAIESDREYGLSVLRRIDAEMTRRGELFRQVQAQDIGAYRKIIGQKLPRTVLIVDEFQVFFAEDDRLAQDAAILLEQLVRQGRAFGIHVILGSQTLAGASSLARSTLGQMAVRITLQCSEADSQLILDDGNVAARLLSRPGEAIYNDAGGLVVGNSPFQTAWLPDHKRETYLRGLAERVAKDNIILAEPIVFEGNAPVTLSANSLLSSRIDQLDQPDSNEPPCAWLGEPVAIKEPTAVRFNRQSGNHLIIIGQRDDAAMGILSAAMLSLAACHSPGQVRFVILNGAPADSPFADQLDTIAAAIPHEHLVVPWRQTPEIIDQIDRDVQQRLQNDRQHESPTYLLIYGLQRYRVLRRNEDDFGFSSSDQETPKPDKQFVDILKEGPAVGIHVLVWADSLATVERTIDRYTLREFDNRVLFQMSAADSSNLIDSPLANRLGRHRALYYNEELGLVEKFRPYAPVEKKWLNQFIEKLNHKYKL